MEWSIKERNDAITELHNSPFRVKLESMARRIHKRGGAKFAELAIDVPDLVQEAWAGIISEPNLASLEHNYLLTVGASAISDATKKSRIKTVEYVDKTESNYNE